jgi:hypothetical protein
MMAMREKMFDDRFHLIHSLDVVCKHGGMSRIAGIGRDRTERRVRFCRMIVNDGGRARPLLAVNVAIHIVDGFFSARS